MFGLNGDCPICTENDELSYAPIALFMATHNTLDPQWITNPASTTIYSLTFYYKLIQLFTGSDIVGAQFTPFQMCFRNMDLLVKWPRLTTVAVVLVSLPFLYVVGRKWMGKAAAMIGVTFYALSPLVVYYGQILRPDMLANLLIILSIFLFDRLCEVTSDRRSAVLVGVTIGLAVSTRFFCLALLAALATIYGVALLRPGSLAKKMEVIFCALIAVATCFATFFISSPFVFLEFHRLLDDLKFESQADFADLTGLGPFGNLRYYFVEGIPQALGGWLTCSALIGFLFVPFRKRTFKSFIYLTLLTIFLIGTCLNPRHWARWVLPMLPILSMLASFGLTTTFELVNNLMSQRIADGTARKCSFLVVLILGCSACFFPIRHLFSHQWQKSHLSERALVFPFIKKSIPRESKIALDCSWEWPDQELYRVTPDLWRPDFIPPRPHNYYLPEDLARDGFQYMLVQRKNRMYYSLSENRAKYPREYTFFQALSRRAPLICDTYRPHPVILGKEIGYRFTPIEVYDLRPLANTNMLKK